MKGSGKGWGVWAMLLGLALAGQQVAAGPLQERLKARQADQAIQEDEDDAPAGDFLPEGARVLKDQAYGPDRRQRYDVYLPAQTQGAPVILMVHGGAWRFGSKSRGGVVEHKVARWVAQGFILVSSDYRLLPAAAPAEQVRDVARALATVRARAAGWGGDPDRVVLMGHSAGAHLVALLAASPRTSPGVVGTVLLDSAALDVPALMRAPHLPLYDQAFGASPADWVAVSPYHALAAGGAPILAVCSRQRQESCSEVEHFQQRAARLGTRVQSLPEPMSHRDINRELGKPGAYTDDVESFLRTLVPAL